MVWLMNKVSEIKFNLHSWVRKAFYDLPSVYLSAYLVNNLSPSTPDYWQFMAHCAPSCLWDFAVAFPWNSLPSYSSCVTV